MSDFFVEIEKRLSVSYSVCRINMVDIVLNYSKKEAEMPFFAKQKAVIASDGYRIRHQ